MAIEAAMPHNDGMGTASHTPTTHLRTFGGRAARLAVTISALVATAVYAAGCGRDDRSRAEEAPLPNLATDAAPRGFGERLALGRLGGTGSPKDLVPALTGASGRGVSVGGDSARNRLGIDQGEYNDRVHAFLALKELREQYLSVGMVPAHLHRLVEDLRLHMVRFGTPDESAQLIGRIVEDLDSLARADGMASREPLTLGAPSAARGLRDPGFFDDGLDRMRLDSGFRPDSPLSSGSESLTRAERLRRLCEHIDALERMLNARDIEDGFPGAAGAPPSLSADLPGAGTKARVAPPEPRR
ncbi:MAG TPA: hypothetical protein VLH79_06020 [Chthonomonadales bacterium]|nr:hypothetical protein [Chthonomonadales bacterium]